MPYNQSGQIRYYSFDLLDQFKILNAAITRQGGVSPSPWKSLNLGGTVGDKSERVAENRQIVNNSFGIDQTKIFDVWQVHGTDVVCTREPRQPNTPYQKADAILTDQPGIWLLMRFADCVPVLLYDPVRRVIGIAHAGWKGTAFGVVGKAVQQMVESYGVNPCDIRAAIGPSIGPDHYRIGQDVIDEMHHWLGPTADRFLFSVNSSVHLDLWASNQWILQQAGVEFIENPGICTACHLEDWFSHRAEHGKTGRFGILIGLQE